MANQHSFGARIIEGEIGIFIDRDFLYGCKRVRIENGYGRIASVGRESEMQIGNDGDAVHARRVLDFAQHFAGIGIQDVNIRTVRDI